MRDAASGRRELPILEHRRHVVGALEGGHFEGVLACQQGASKCVVEAMTRLERGVLPDERMAQQVEIADGVQHLVLHELVVVAQALGVEHAVLVQHNRILQAAAQRQTRGAHGLDILHEPERSGARDFLHVRVLGEIDDDVPVLRPEHRMREVDREIELEAVERIEACPLVAVAHLDGCKDAQIALRRVLLDDAGRLQQEDERPGTAIHDRDLGSGNVDVEVVDAKARERGHQVLDGGNAGTVMLQRRRQPRVADMQGVGGNGNGGRKVDPMKDDPGVCHARPQRNLDARAGMQADAGRLDRRFEGALLLHGFRIFAGSPRGQAGNESPAGSRP